MMTLADTQRDELANKLKMTAVSVTSMERKFHVTVFVMARHDGNGAVRIDSDLLLRAVQKKGIMPGERCNYFA
jgi:hypothetical protein